VKIIHSRRFRIASAALGLLVALVIPSHASPFAVFPKAGELVSPGGRFVVRDAAREASSSEFVGLFHSLWLTDRANGKSRKLCDYSNVAAVAWSGDNVILVTHYVSKKSSRTLVFFADSQLALLLDQPRLIQLVPVPLRDTLRENDHVFIEASNMEKEKLSLRVWGYGRHDTKGFRWRCEYELKEGNILCSEDHKPD
jgi:hypothetical protein